MRHASLRSSVFLCVLLLASRAARSDAFERWYIVQIDGSKAGWAREFESLADNRITTESEMKFAFARMGHKAEVAMSTRFIESAAGEPLEMSSNQKLGEQEVRETYTFVRGVASNEVLHTTDSAGNRTTRQHPWPAVPAGEWMPPAAARRFVAERLAAGDDTITYSTLDPSVGLTVATLTERIINRHAVVEAAGKTLPAMEWEVTNSLIPGMKGRDFVDDQGRALRTEIDLGGMKMVMLASEKEAALSDFSPPEMMAQTLIKPSGKPIENPRTARRAVYILSMADGSDIPDLPSVGGQVVERMDAKKVRVEVVRGRRSKATEITPPPDPFGKAVPLPITDQHDEERDPNLAPSTMVDSRDPRVIELARQIQFHWAWFNDADLQAGLRRSYAAHVALFVREYLNDESLGVGLASASEVARTRRGDCTEHAVLTAAILRVKELGQTPARVASGLVLVLDPDGATVFGYHMWTQARTCGKTECDWFDVDAAIPSSGDAPGVDATHIALATSTMADGDMINSMAALVGLLGRLKIEVVEVE